MKLKYDKIIIGDNMEDKILEILGSENKAFDVHEIESSLNITTAKELTELLKELNRLEDEYKIYRTKKDKYMLFSNSNLRIGKFLGTKRSYAFIDIEGNDDVFVHQDNFNGAIHGDEVIVEITSKKGMKLEGRIVKVRKEYWISCNRLFTINRFIFKIFRKQTTRSIRYIKGIKAYGIRAKSTSSSTCPTFTFSRTKKRKSKTNS